MVAGASAESGPGQSVAPPDSPESESILGAEVIVGNDRMRWEVVSIDHPIAMWEDRWAYTGLLLRVFRDRQLVTELPYRVRFDAQTGVGTLVYPTIVTVGDRNLVRVTVDKHEPTGSVFGDDVLFAFVDGDIRSVGHVPSDSVLVAPMGDWRRIRTEYGRHRFSFDGERYVPDDGLFAEPLREQDGKLPERVVLDWCGRWDCCITGDTLKYNTMLYETLDAPKATIEVPANSVIENIEFFWVFENLVEVKVIPEDDCDPHEEIGRLDTTRAEPAIILDWLEENGASVWLNGAWRQVSASCVYPYVGPGPSMNWVRLILEDGREGLLPLNWLRVKSSDETNDLAGGDQEGCLFGRSISPFP
jgi:hypothetical protein